MKKGTDTHQQEGSHAAVQCDRMCAECTKTCTRDWGHSGPHRCDDHYRG